MKNQLLPIGSIVTIGKDNTMIMINGYGMINNNNREFYDYSGAVYPIGFNAQDVKLFNREDVKDVIFVGYQSKSFKTYREWVDEFINNVRSGKSIDEAAKILTQRVKEGK